MGKTTVRDEKAEDGLRIAETKIDLLAIGKGAKAYLVGECKFKGHPFTYSEYLDTLAKLSPLKKGAMFHYALFSESGFDERIETEAQKGNVRLYPLHTIVNYKRMSNGTA